MKYLPFAIACSLCLGAAAAQAQQDSTPAQRAAAALNHQQADFARHQLDQNAANRRAYQEAVAARNAKIRRQQAAHAAALRAHDARVAQYRAAMRQWRADVAACKTGVRSRCAHKQPAK